ncbi:MULTISPECIES: IS21 family transposase [Burkholderiales]|uniref:IS21 family transposase n=1 Tax=Burkholderiales TaxID=80840 RepID=UPI00189EEE02|nr:MULTISPECIES: IS21 family transposase [Burkholderiales]MBY4823311.1 IS21 family transposase [Burkholderia contaminans]
MRIVRDVLRYTFEMNYSQRRIATMTGFSRRVVERILRQFEKVGLKWPIPPEIDDKKLDDLINPKTRVRPSFGKIDFADVDLQLKKPGATLAILHEEWRAQSPESNLYQYASFCKMYRAWKKSQRLSMRGEIHYGEAAFVDYSGKTVAITDKTTGEIRQAQLFVGVLGGSNYTYAELTWTQRIPDWIASHVRMFEFFGGVPETVVPDNLKSAVAVADRYEPRINESYLQLCRHYGAAPLPARSGKPKDKSRAEAAVLLCQRWILFRLRKRIFFTLAEANQSIRALLEELNRKSFQKIAGSRFSRWIEHEQPALKSLPTERYEAAEWGIVRAGPDYLVRIDGHSYSVPHDKRGQEFDYRATNTSIELLQFNQSIVTHIRSTEKDGVTMLPAHRAAAHDAVQGWTKERAMNWAKEIGPMTAQHLEILLDRCRGRHSGYRTTQAMRNLAKKYGNTRLEKVCAYASTNNILGTKDLRDVLSKKLDLLMEEESVEEHSPTIDHCNIRGSAHYQSLLQTHGEKKDDE